MHLGYSIQIHVRRGFTVETRVLSSARCLRAPPNLQSTRSDPINTTYRTAFGFNVNDLAPVVYLLYVCCRDQTRVQSKTGD